ncbi:MAG TPA: hypothetical protein VM869_14410 [Enhygromyxa sp.]|nr:hypothetical protein [Enhygromyxa sp.]
MKDIQRRVGVALSPEEHYERAFAQGVLLGPQQFGRAAELFEQAASRAHKAGDQPLERRARANALLYRFICEGSGTALGPLHGMLAHLDRIERIGSQREFVDAGALAHEISGRLAEYSIATCRESDHQTRARLHQTAAHAFKQLGTRPLATYHHRPDGLPTDAIQRYFLHDGLGQRHAALAESVRSPSDAAELMARATTALQQCAVPSYGAEAEQWLSRLRTRRNCWMCQREFTGAQIHFHRVPATVHVHAIDVVRRAGQDLACLDVGDQTVILCKVCSSAITALADAQAQVRVAELEARLESRFAELTRAITALDQRVTALSAIRR